MKKAIVIGCSSGIGLSVARRLLSDGWMLGVAARREDRLMALQREYPSGHVNVAVIDVNEADATQRLRHLIDCMGGISLFIYSSGIGKQNATLAEDVELSTVTTNALGFTRMIGEAYRYFSQQGGGHIAAITSIAGTKGLGNAPAYSATKAMQATYIQALEQLSLKNHLNIRFTDIRPGFVDTDLLSGTHHYPMLLNTEEVARQIVKAIYKKKHVVVIDWRWRVLTAVWRRIPRWLWRLMKV